MNSLIPFQYNSKQVRTVIKDGEPWFVAKDICDILGIGNANMAAARLDNDDVSQTEVTDNLGRRQFTNIINESGLYDLILRSDKPDAKPFRKWVTGDVLPSIRKHGMYAKDELLDNPDLMIEVLQELKKEREEKRLLQTQNNEMKPKADFFDAVANSKDAIEIGQAAKVLNFGKGRNTLFAILREEKILRDNNEPYQEYIDRGYFRTIEQKYTKPGGETCISIKTLVYQRGLDYIKKIIDRRKSA